jgi:hypothetical protein
MGVWELLDVEGEMGGLVEGVCGRMMERDWTNRVRVLVRYALGWTITLLLREVLEGVSMKREVVAFDEIMGNGAYGCVIYRF